MREGNFRISHEQQMNLLALWEWVNFLRRTSQPIQGGDWANGMPGGDAAPRGLGRKGVNPSGRARAPGNEPRGCKEAGKASGGRQVSSNGRASLELYLESKLGVDEVPLTYVIREHEAPLTPAELVQLPADTDDEQKIIACASLTGAIFKSDKKVVHSVIVESIQGTQIESVQHGKRWLELRMGGNFS